MPHEWVYDESGRSWSPEDFARELGRLLSPSSFVTFLADAFDLWADRSAEEYERVHRLLAIRDEEVERAFPSGRVYGEGEQLDRP